MSGTISGKIKFFFYTTLLLIIALCVVILVFGKPFVTVSPGHRAVVISKFTSVHPAPLNDGFHFIPEGLIPWNLELLIYPVSKSTLTHTIHKTLYRRFNDEEIHSAYHFSLTYEFQLTRVDFKAAVLSLMHAAEAKTAAAKNRSTVLLPRTAEVILTRRFMILDQKYQVTVNKPVYSEAHRDVVQARLKDLTAALKADMLPYGISIVNVDLLDIVMPLDREARHLLETDDAAKSIHKYLLEKYIVAKSDALIKAHQQKQELNNLREISAEIKKNPLLIKYLYTTHLAKNAKVIISDQHIEEKELLSAGKIENLLDRYLGRRSYGRPDRTAPDITVPADRKTDKAAAARNTKPKKTGIVKKTRPKFLR